MEKYTVRQADDGFTLVEVLVALVMASFLLVIVLDGASSARSRSQYAVSHEAGVRLGEAVLARAGSDPDIRKGHGSEGGLDWTTTRQVLMADQRGLYALVATQVEVTKAGHRLERFSARHLERVAAR